MCGQAEFWSDPDCEKGHPSALNPPAGSSPVQTRIRGYSSPIAAPRNQRRRAAQRGPTWDAQPAFLCFSLPGQGDWQFPAFTTWKTLSFLVITKIHGLWTILWPRDRWYDSPKVLELVNAVAKLGTPDIQRTPRRDPDCMFHCWRAEREQPKGFPNSGLNFQK